MGSLVSFIPPFTFPFLHYSDKSWTFKIFHYVSLKENLLFYNITPNIRFLISLHVHLVFKCSIVHKFLLFFLFSQVLFESDVNKMYLLWLIEMFIKSLLVYRFFSIFFPSVYLLKKLSCIFCRARVGKVFLKGVGRKYFSHCGPYGLCYTDSALPLLCESSCRP